MFGIGVPEMILILAVALVVIGPKKLPDLAKSMGRALGEFKKATRDFKESMDVEEFKELNGVKTAFQDINSDIKAATDIKSNLTDIAKNESTPHNDSEKESGKDLEEKSAKDQELDPENTPGEDLEKKSEEERELKPEEKPAKDPEKESGKNSEIESEKEMAAEKEPSKDV